MTISYRGRYESVYRERFGHIVYTERGKKKIYIFVLKKQFNVYKMFALYDTAVNDRLFATYSFVSMEIQKKLIKCEVWLF